MALNWLLDQLRAGLGDMMDAETEGTIRQFFEQRADVVDLASFHNAAMDFIMNMKMQDSGTENPAYMVINNLIEAVKERFPNIGTNDERD
jgi:hypothetical protein